MTADFPRGGDPVVPVSRKRGLLTLEGPVLKRNPRNNDKYKNVQFDDSKELLDKLRSRVSMQPFRFSSLRIGMLLLGIVKRTINNQVMVGLPNHLFGTADIVSGMVVEPGMLVAVEIVALESIQKRHIRLSLTPKTAEVVAGDTVVGTVGDVLDHGYLVTLFVSEQPAEGFLPFEKAPKNLEAGSVVLVVVTMYDKIKSRLLQLSMDYGSNSTSSGHIFPGSHVTARISHLDDKCAVVSLQGSHEMAVVESYRFFGVKPRLNEIWPKENPLTVIYVDSASGKIGLSAAPHLHNQGSCRDMFVHMSTRRQLAGKVVSMNSLGILLDSEEDFPLRIRISSSQTPKLPSLGIGSVVDTIRVLNFDPIDMVFYGSMMPGEDVFSGEQLRPGDVVKGVVCKVDEYGASIRIRMSENETCTGTCKRLHWTESDGVRAGSASLEEGKESRFRVLENGSKNLQLTHKHTLVRSALPILDKPGLCNLQTLFPKGTHGFVVHVANGKSLVVFYGGIRGTLDEICEVGEVVRVYPLSYEEKRERYLLSRKPSSRVEIGDVLEMEVGSIEDGFALVHKDEFKGRVPIFRFNTTDMHMDSTKGVSRLSLSVKGFLDPLSFKRVWIWQSGSLLIMSAIEEKNKSGVVRAVVNRIDFPGLCLKISVLGDRLDVGEESGVFVRVKDVDVSLFSFEYIPVDHGNAVVNSLEDMTKRSPLSFFESGQMIETVAVDGKYSVGLETNADVLQTVAQGMGTVPAPLSVVELAHMAMNRELWGWVMGMGRHGVFVALSPTLVGRVLVKNTTSAFTQNWMSMMPAIGCLVRVWFIKLDSEGRIELSLKGPIVKGGPKNIQKPILADEDVSFEDAAAADRKHAQSLLASIVDEEMSSGVEMESGSEIEVDVDSESSVSEEEDVDPVMLEEEDVRAEGAVAIDMVEKTLAEGGRELTSARDYEREVLADPGSSYWWIRYMAFALVKGDILETRRISDRALQTIPYRLETEKLNVWMAWLSFEWRLAVGELELVAGHPLTSGQGARKGDFSYMDKVISDAVLRADQKKIYMTLWDMYERTFFAADGEASMRRRVIHRLRELEKTVLVKLRTSCEMWLRVWNFHVRRDERKEAQMLYDRAMGALGTKKLEFQLKVALLEFDKERERGRSGMESLLTAYPKRFDIWLLYINAEIKSDAAPDGIRRLLDRALSLPFSSKRIKTLFKIYLEYEKKHGDTTSVQRVRDMAMEYVEKMSASTLHA